VGIKHFPARPVEKEVLENRNKTEKRFILKSHMNEKEMISVVIPVFNECGSVVTLHNEVVNTFSETKTPFEIIFVDDGSTDNTVLEIKKLSPVKLIRFRRNFGQTAALDAGIKASKGAIIVTLDGDGQNDPHDIPALISKLKEGYDVVAGWRWERKDPFNKRFISGGANILRRVFVKDGIHDSGCTLKAFNRKCFNSLDLSGEIHRFIPGILASQGFKIGEMKHGRTKYGLSRTVKGFLDMIGIWFWREYSARPLHILGGLGLLLGVGGGLLLCVLFVLRIVGAIALKESILPLLGFFLVLTGIQLLVSGIIADIALKNYYRSKSERPYSIDETIEL
jgi:glycosyltransferase involved in cell wall biosynthesis